MASHAGVEATSQFPDGTDARVENTSQSCVLCHFASSLGILVLTPPSRPYPALSSPTCPLPHRRVSTRRCSPSCPRLAPRAAAQRAVERAQRKERRGTTHTLPVWLLRVTVEVVIRGHRLRRTAAGIEQQKDLEHSGAAGGPHPSVRHDPTILPPAQYLITHLQTGRTKLPRDPRDPSDDYRLGSRQIFWRETWRGLQSEVLRGGAEARVEEEEPAWLMVARLRRALGPLIGGGACVAVALVSLAVHVCLRPAVLSLWVTAARYPV